MKSKALVVFIIIALGCALLLACLYQLTYPRIQVNQEQAFALKLKQLVSTVAYDNEPQKKPLYIQSKEYLGSDQPMPLYVLRKNNIPVAFVFNAVASDGYNGDIFLLIALDPSGNVLGVRITKHHETPGLGDYFDKNNHQWLQQFIGKNKHAMWNVKKEGGEFDAWSGATITPRAITHAIDRVLNYYALHKQELMQ